MIGKPKIKVTEEQKEQLLEKVTMVDPGVVRAERMESIDEEKAEQEFAETMAKECNCDGVIEEKCIPCCPPADIHVYFHQMSTYFANAQITITCSDRHPGHIKTLNIQHKTLSEVLDELNYYIRDNYGRHIDVHYHHSSDITEVLKEYGIKL